MEIYDLAILGAGPGGYVAAEKAAAAGLKTILFEKNELGGVCLNEGCIPTKTLLFSAKTLTHAQEAGKYGIELTEEAAINWQKVMARKEKVTKKLVGGIKVGLRDTGVETVRAEAVLKGRDADGTIAIEAGGMGYNAKNLLICTGSSTAVPPIPGIENAITSCEALNLQTIPESLVIIGGGVIGIEFAALYNALSTKVTVIEMMPEILGAMDREISGMLRQQLTAKGIEFHLGCRVTGVESGAVNYRTEEGEPCRAEGAQILLSVGRKANLEGFGLETLGVETGRGIVVDRHMRTSVSGVYAAGDVTGFSMLAHTASREGEVAVNDILGIEDEMSYDAIPGVVYTNPEVAGAGLTEEAAEGRDVKISKLPMGYSGRFVAENERGTGLCKIISDAASGRVLGVHMIGTPCSEIIQSACICIEKGLTVSDLQRIVFPHPTVGEILKETAKN